MGVINNVQKSLLKLDAGPNYISRQE